MCEKCNSMSKEKDHVSKAGWDVYTSHSTRIRSKSISFCIYKPTTLSWSVSMQVLRDVGMERWSPLTCEVKNCQRKKKSKVPFQIKMNLLIIYLYMRHCVPCLAIWTQHAEYHGIETLPWCCQMQDCVCGKPIRKPSGFAWASSLTPFLAHDMKWQRGHCQTFQSRSSSQWYTHTALYRSSFSYWAIWLASGLLSHWFI